MKKIIKIICLPLVITYLCACGPGATSHEPFGSVDTIWVEMDGVIRKKQVVKIAAIDESAYWLPAVIAGFNESDENYHAVVYYYLDDNTLRTLDIQLDDIDKAIDDAINRFNIDVTTRNVPDILIPLTTYDFMKMNSYIGKGLLADLNEFIDNDPDFDRADYLPSLFDAFDRDGGMYEISPLFRINAMQAKTADVGKDFSWTLDEFAAFIESKPDAQYILGYLTKRDFIVKMTGYLFINPVSGEIIFDRDEFKKILKIAERFPAELSRGFWENYQEIMAGVKDGDPLMLPIITGGFYHTKDLESKYFGEETTIKGWPSSTDNGILFQPHGTFSILKPAGNPDGAWAFLKYALHHAMCKDRTLMPVHLTLLEEMAASEYDYLLEEEGIGGAPDFFSDVKIDQSDIDQIMMLYQSAGTLDRENRAIVSIIGEEIGSYLSGQKPADTITDIIENRITLYLAEQE